MNADPTPPAGHPNPVEGDHSDASARAATVSHIRHELRTPVGHILGYAEILLEDAMDEGWGVDVESLRGVLDRGKQLVAILDRCLNLDDGEKDGPLDLAGLRRELSLPSGQILAIARGLQETGQGKASARYAADLAKVGAACTRLDDLAAGLG